MNCHTFVHLLLLFIVFKHHHIHNNYHSPQSSNRRILFNLLPAHVATHFLDNQFRSNMVNNHSSPCQCFSQYIQYYRISHIILLPHSSLVSHIRKKLQNSIQPHRESSICVESVESTLLNISSFCGEFSNWQSSIPNPKAQ